MVANTPENPPIAIDPNRPKDPLHGITLEGIINKLVEYYGWHELGWRIRINCFNDDPSIKSSLKFLRKTPWARSKVEALYVEMLTEQSQAAPEQALETPTPD
jgi:uncharacterized protein (DUF2132 family)